MKIGYDGSGNIVAVTIDSEQLVAPNVLSVADDADYMMNPGKYVVSGGAAVRRRYLVLSTTGSPVAHGTPIAIAVAAFLGDGTPDAAGVDVLDIQGGPFVQVFGFTSPITLVAGAASFNVESVSAQNVTICGRCSTAWVAPLAVSFT